MLIPKCGSTSIRQVLLRYMQDKIDAGGYPIGSILMDEPPHQAVEGLVELARDKANWNMDVMNAIKLHVGSAANNSKRSIDQNENKAKRKKTNNLHVMN